MGLVNLLSRDHVVILYGGRHAQYRIVFENLLEQLQSVANLVFFEDGPVVSAKIDTWTKRQNEKYFRMIDVIDKVNDGIPLQEIVETTRDFPTAATFLTMIEEIAMIYGKLVVTVTKECDAELARYANNDPSVVAVLADDSDFLIFGGRWRYVSINQLDLETLVTLEYDKCALRNYLGLNDEQLKVFSVLGGNDIIQYQEVRKFHDYYCGHDARNKFPFLAKFIREQMPPNHQVVDWIASEVLQDSRPFTKERIVESLMQYRTVRKKFRELLSKLIKTFVAEI
jgi:XPG domain containing